MLTGGNMSASLRGLKRRFSALCPVGFTSQLRRNPPVRCAEGGRRLSDTQTAGGNLRPLEGVTVLDLTRVLAGPFATMILGDLGAEVIKVERPGAGDDTRAWGPPFVGAESTYFLSVNRNKKSISVDLKHPRGAAVIQELAGVCDVLVENYLPGKLHQMGLGYEQLSRVNPQLIYCSISGYGQTGPRSQSPGYDSIASAVSGMMHITGPEDGEPVRPGVAMTDLATGLYAHGAIMAALLQRQKTGRGVHIDCNLLSSQGFKTKDGHIVMAAGNNKQFVKVCQVLQLMELTDEPKYKTNKLRVQNRQQLLHTLSQRFLQEKTADWLKRFEGSGVPVGPINSIQDVFSDSQSRICLEHHLAVVHPMVFLQVTQVKTSPLQIRVLHGQLAAGAAVLLCTHLTLSEMQSTYLVISEYLLFLVTETESASPGTT
ncbi:succinate--hydroxymethylglutarate CoA-transferase isoform X5 [Epinephelus moara]|uniref:succinate--hydroxymethylglutarate CoA-transferase isoform X5 n=1 Tax=Epinephelus moara TaxID=300413 RepID=UPI00214F27DF|nr:succinate--hydroxymethylglutarate CoA-transferase isoform X5 [Epinephelus moara]